MRTGAFLRSTLLLFAAACPALLLAQFQQPTDEELKMTADPKAPGAAAVFLNVTEISNNPLHFQSYYARIKILTEKGEALATVELPYEKDEYQYEVAAIQGRTIHPDGTVVPLTGKPADLLITKNGDTQYRRKAFTLPSVEVGSIIEYYFQLRCGEDYYFPLPHWQVQHDYLVHKAHYFFTPDMGDESLAVSSVLPAGVAPKKEALGRFSLDLEDVPPAPQEEWMPPITSALFKVVFYYQDLNGLDDFWQNAGKKWSRSVEQFTEPSKSFRGSVSALIAPGDTDLDKAKKLYKAVQSLDNTDFSREKSSAERKDLKLKSVKRAEDGWKQKSGSRTEIALLYLSMLRAAGLTAYAMRVVDRNKGVFTPSDFNLDQLDSTIVILSIDGKEMFLDPGEKLCPFQTVDWRHSRAAGLRQSASGTVIGTSPPQAYGSNTVLRIADLTLDSHGAVEGSIRFVLSGQEALHWRQIALENDESEVKKQFDEWVAGTVPDGVEAHIDHFVALDDPESNLTAIVNAHGTIATITSKRYLLPGLFFETRGSHPFVNQDMRRTPVDMHYGEQISDEVVYHLPAGLEVENAPEANKIPWEGHAVLLIKSKVEPSQVTVTRTLARAFTLAKPEEYQYLRGFYLKVAAADQQQLILTASSAAKGK
jgi:hypothetical protein